VRRPAVDDDLGHRFIVRKVDHRLSTEHWTSRQSPCDAGSTSSVMAASDMARQYPQQRRAA
jgi:hypothetical protein